MAKGASKALWIIVATVFAAAAAVIPAAVGQRVPCYFVLGDSGFDNGNNNVLNTKTKANYLPYGIDFPQGPTGRLSTGRNIPDVLAQLEGFNKFIPPSAGASVAQANTGLNYASGHGGIRQDTNKNMELYVLGARNVALFGISKIGCTPRAIASLGGGTSCAEEVNQAVIVFNNELKALVIDLNEKLSGVKFTDVDPYSGDSQDFAAFGVTVSNRSFCTVAAGEELSLNRNKYVFWDNVHTTELIKVLVANSAFNGTIASPFTIFQLVN